MAQSETPLQAVPPRSDAACAEAMNHQIAGRLDLAEQIYRDIVNTEPKHAAANHCIGMLYVQRQRPREGLPYLLTALEANPQVPDYWLGYLEALLASGQGVEARQVFAVAQAHGLDGPAAQEFSRRLAPSTMPAVAAPHPPTAAPHPLAAAARPAAAQPRSQRAERRRTGRAARGMERSLFGLVKSGNFAEALRAAQNITALFPERGAGWKTLGAVLWAGERRDEGVAAMKKAAQLLPDDAEAHSNLGAALTKLERYDEAEIHLHRALEINPDFAAAYIPLGDIYVMQGRYAEAEAVLRKSIALSPGVREHDEELRRTSLLFVLSHSPGVDPERLFAEHRQVGAFLEGQFRSSWVQHRNVADPVRPLKVGMVSGDFRNHPVADFLEPILAQLRRYQDLELHGYYNNTVTDAVTGRLTGYFRHWRAVSKLNDAQLAKQVMDDKIDILLDLSGHTALNRLNTFARKPAPIQVSWLGYPGTTGLSEAMDYYLGDDRWLPPGEFDRFFSEKLVYLPDRWAFQPHAGAPDVSELPALETGQLTFGSFHRLVKINSFTVRLWADLMLALPGSTLVLVGNPPDRGQRLLVERFNALGIETGRLSLHDRCPMDRYLAIHNQVDIALDAQPYSGGTTTMHSLSMGVPTLTLAGTTSTARAAAGILAGVGLHEFIAANAAEFVEKGVYWANHLQLLAEVRSGLRRRLAQSPCGNPELIAAHVSGALRQMWTRWCAGLAPASFRSRDTGEAAR